MTLYLIMYFKDKLRYTVQLNELNEAKFHQDYPNAKAVEIIKMTAEKSA